jgi:pimeloyl-ACP methyl ester carboxylesterase
MTHYVSDLSGERRIAYQVTGARDGFPVFLLHGTPGSRLGPQPRSVQLYRRHICLITYDRPGYGESTRMPRRTVADAVTDVKMIADDMGIDRFAVVGRSGGGPHALACAALLPEMVTSVASMVALAPRNAEALDWNGGMTRANVEEFDMAHTDPAGLRTRFQDRMCEVRRDPTSMLPVLDAGLHITDRLVIRDGGIRNQLLDTYREAFNDDLWGHFDDVVALADPHGWGFKFDEIRAPVMLWHGGHDAFVPKAHTEWLARRIAGSHVVIEPWAAHFSAIERLPDVLAWVVANAAPAPVHAVASEADHQAFDGVRAAG